MNLNTDLLHQLLNPPAIVEQYKPSKLEIIAQSKQENDLCGEFHDDNILEEISERIKNSGTMPILINDVEFGSTKYLLKINPKNKSIIAGFIYDTDENNDIYLHQIIYFRDGQSNAVMVSYKKTKGEIDWKDEKNIESICLDKKNYLKLILEKVYEIYQMKKRKKELEKQLKSDEGIEIKV